MREPALLALGLAEGQKGSKLSLFGQYFGSVMPKVLFQMVGGNKVIAGAVLKGNSDTSLRVIVPKKLSSGDYTVAVGNMAGISSTITFTVND